MIRIGVKMIALLVLLMNYNISAQQYSFSTFAFRIYDKDSIIGTLKYVNGLNHQWIPKLHLDSLSLFGIAAIYPNEDNSYQDVAKHTKGVWILFSENVKKWRPVRFFSIQKRQRNGEFTEMRIFINYNYQSCEMPCIFGQSVFKVSEIQFNEGNYMLLDRLSLSDWKNSSPNIIKMNEDIMDYIVRNHIIFWDIEMKN